MSAYSPTNTAARTCPDVNAGWAASSVLPPIANSKVCDCMVKSLKCKAKADISGEDIATQFEYVCGQDAKACNGFAANATTGKYGAYSMCSAEQKLSFAFDQYFQAQGGASTACDFSGNGETQAGSNEGDCTALLEAAGKDGSGTVNDVPTEGSTGEGSGDKDNAAGSFAAFSMGSYVVAAMLAGLGMVLL